MLLQSIHQTQEVFPKKIISAVFNDVVPCSAVTFNNVSEEPADPIIRVN